MEKQAYPYRLVHKDTEIETIPDLVAVSIVSHLGPNALYLTTVSKLGDAVTLTNTLDQYLATISGEQDEVHTLIRVLAEKLRITLKTYRMTISGPRVPGIAYMRTRPPAYTAYEEATTLTRDLLHTLSTLYGKYANNIAIDRIQAFDDDTLVADVEQAMWIKLAESHNLSVRYATMDVKEYLTRNDQWDGLVIRALFVCNLFAAQIANENAESIFRMPRIFKD